MNGAGSDEEADHSEPPIDVVHLDRQTMGQTALKREVLILFVNHVSNQLAELRLATVPSARKAAAHSIRSAATGVGAWRVASLAERIETGATNIAVVLPDLEEALDAARRQVETLLGP